MKLKSNSLNVGIVIPLYNEEKVIEGVLQELHQKYPYYMLIVVDDGSRDESVQRACIEGVFLLQHSTNLGQGAALQTGIEYAKELGCKYVVTFDADGQHNPDDITLFIRTLENDEADIVLGSRFLGKAENIPFARKYLLKVSRIFTWFTTGIWLTDSQNGLRAINIEKFPQFEITQNRMAHASEIISIIKRLKMRHVEKPCNICYSNYSIQKGQSMFNSINIIMEYFVGNMMK